MSRWLEFTLDNTWHAQKYGSGKVRGFFRDIEYARSVKDRPMALLQLADFVYVVKTDEIVKNRLDIQSLYELAFELLQLKYHNDDAVRNMYEKTSTLAILSDSTTYRTNNELV